jgi:hypothetical protein
MPFTTRDELARQAAERTGHEQGQAKTAPNSVPAELKKAVDG